MYQELLGKKRILDARKPYSAEAVKELKEIELCDLIYTSLHLDGSEISREQVKRILDGEYVVEATTINDHLAIENYIEVLSLINNLFGMHSDINEKVILDIHEAVCGGEGQIWRRSNPVLYTFDYTPPGRDQVRKKLDDLIRWLYRADEELGNNVILKAAYLHCRLIEIYPFEYYNEVTARIVMYYLLLREGYPVCELRISESEYNRAIMEYLGHGKIDSFYRVLERNMFNKLDVILQLTIEDEE